MNDLDLNGMQAAHAFEPHGARCLAPVQQAVRVGHVAVNRIDGLDVRGVRGVDHPHPCVERFSPGRRFRHTQVGGVVFQANRDSGNALGRGRDGESILDAERRLQDGH